MTHEKMTIGAIRFRAHGSPVVTATAPKGSCRPRGPRGTGTARSPVVQRLGAAGVLLAAPAVVRADVLDSGDTAWMICATALVLFMAIPGLALFYAGMVRSKNVLSIFAQCFAVAGLVSILGRSMPTVSHSGKGPDPSAVSGGRS